MSTAVYERIRNNPKFDELVSKRSRFAWTLTAIVLGIYFTFIMVVAFNPKLLATPIFSGWTASIAWPIGVGMILLFWLMTGLYVRRANSEFDDINAEIIKGAIE
jgi:cation/acetate symporter